MPVVELNALRQVAQRVVRAGLVGDDVDLDAPPQQLREDGRRRFAMFGGALGLLLAEGALRALVIFGADLIPRVAEISIDPIALAFTLTATLVTGLVIGLLPAMQASGVNVLDALKAAGPGSVGSGRHLRAGLLVVEVSLSLVLLIAAGLLLTSFARLQRVDPGFEPEGVFTAQIALPRHYSPAQTLEFYEQFSQVLATLPGASSAALSDPYR